MLDDLGILITFSKARGENDVIHSSPLPAESTIISLIGEKKQRPVQLILCQAAQSSLMALNWCWRHSLWSDGLVPRTLL